MNDAAPGTPKELNNRLLADYGKLSNRLQQIARFALDHPNDMALETITVIAERAGAQPSAVVRFAKALGYSGFSDMQRVFQQRLADGSPSYSERIRRFREEQGTADEPTVSRVLREFCEVNRISLDHLPGNIDAGLLDRGVDVLAAARTVHLCGQRRAFPVIAFLAYALGRIDCHANLLDGVGGMLMQQARAMRRDDVLLAVSFSPYAPETAAVVAQAAEVGCPIVAFTDSPLSPIASNADVCFEVHDAEIHTFRSLTATMCLAQALAVGVGLRLEKGLSQEQRKPS